MLNLKRPVNEQIGDCPLRQNRIARLSAGALSSKLIHQIPARDRPPVLLWTKRGSSPKEDEERLAKAALGLTLHEAENAFARAMGANKPALFPLEVLRESGRGKEPP